MALAYRRVLQSCRLGSRAWKKLRVRGYRTIRSTRTSWQRKRILRREQQILRIAWIVWRKERLQFKPQTLQLKAVQTWKVYKVLSKRPKRIKPNLFPNISSRPTLSLVGFGNLQVRTLSYAAISEIVIPPRVATLPL